jgi:hypothetical protein
MTRLVREQLARDGLEALIEARAEQKVPAEAGLWERLMRVDLLSLGAAADAARRRECSEEARVYIPHPPPPGDALFVFGSAERARGSDLLRKIAALRLTSPIGARMVVDFGALGLEIAQVALCFGATDLAGPIASRRGLLVLVDEPKKLVKRREIAGYVERAGFRPVFVATDAAGGPAEPAQAANGTSPRMHVES